MSFVQVPPAAYIQAPASRVPPSPAQISRLAALHPTLTSNQHAKSVLRANGLSSSAANVDSLRNRIREIHRLRANRKLRKVSARIGRELSYLPAPNGRPAVALPKGTPSDRLDSWRKANVLDTAKSCIRFGASGGTSFRVTLTTTPEDVGYRIDIESNWTTYRGAYKGWRANEDHHRITVPRDWRVRVLKRGLAEVDGLMTLTAQLMTSPSNVELYRATWAGQGRGYSVNVSSGYIARFDGFTFHGKTPEEALKGVQRKARTAKQVAKNEDLVEALHESTAAFVARLQEYAHLNVSLSDAYKTGACEFGVRSWCTDVGIDIELGKVPLGRLLEGFKQCPLDEVRRTALHVVRRARRLQQKKEAGTGSIDT